MNLLDRYIAKNFISFFLGGLIVFLTVFLAVDVLSTMVSYKDTAPHFLIEYYLLYIPDIIQKLLPVSCLLGTILTLSTLNKSNELIAMFASGYSLVRISTAILLLVLSISIFSFILSDRVIPSLNRQKNYIYYQEIKKKPGMFSIVKTNRIWYRSKNSIFNIKTLNNEGTKAQGLTLYSFDDNWTLLQMITADEVDINPVVKNVENTSIDGVAANKNSVNESQINNEKKKFKNSNWLLRKGSVTIFSQDSSFPLTSLFREKTIVMTEEARDLQSSGQTSEMLTQKELARFIDKNKQAGLDTIKYEVDYHSKFAFAFAGLVMTILGIPFSVSRARSGGVMINVGICMGLIFVYWIFYNSSITLGTHGHINPILAGWIPNIVMMLLGFVLILKTKK